MTEKATHVGTCQICGCVQKLPGGVLARHGYTLEYGFQNGTCSGSQNLPFEQDNTLAISALSTYQSYLDNFKDVPEPIGMSRCSKEYMDWLSIQQKKRSIKAYILFQQKRLQAWQVKPLTPAPTEIEQQLRASRTTGIREASRAKTTAQYKLNRAIDRISATYLSAAREQGREVNPDLYYRQPNRKTVIKFIEQFTKQEVNDVNKRMEPLFSEITTLLDEFTLASERYTSIKSAS